MVSQNYNIQLVPTFGMPLYNAVAYTAVCDMRFRNRRPYQHALRVIPRLILLFRFPCSITE
jgi:hypothetical protein